MRRRVAELEEQERIHKRVEQELSVAYDALDSVASGIIVANAQGNIRYANPAFLRMFGYAHAPEVLGTHASDIFAGEEIRGLADVQVAIDQEEGETKEFLARRRDGSTFWVLASASTVTDQNGNPVGRMASVVDISKRKRLERQLLHAQKMESIGVLAAGVAHNFNNALQGVIGYADLARSSAEDVPRLCQCLDRIMEAGRRAAALSKQLLSLARRDPGEKASISVPVAVGNVCEILQAMIDSNIQIKWRVDTDLPNALANRVEIEQVLMNICLNARDAMPRGGAIAIEANAVDLGAAAPELPRNGRPGAYVCICISDTGVGMDEETLNRIFDPFFTTKGPDKGTGLGLTTAYGIVENHGGWLDVDSEPGVGSTFRVYLPATNQPAAVPADAESGEPQLGTETILVVDDEEIVLNTTSAFLEKLGYSVLTAKDGREAIGIYKSRGGTIDLIILDYMMPGTNGVAAYHELRRISPDVKVVIASGYDASGEIKSLLDDGAMGFLHKPYSIAELSRVLRGALNAEDAAETGREAGAEHDSDQ